MVSVTSTPQSISTNISAPLQFVRNDMPDLAREMKKPVVPQKRHGNHSFSVPLVETEIAML